MRKHFLLKSKLIFWSFLILTISVNAKEIQCTLNSTSNAYIVKLSPLSEQSYRADIISSNNLSRTLKLIGQYQVLESRQNINRADTLAYSDRQRQFSLYITTGSSFLVAVLNNGPLLGEKLSGPLNCRIINTDVSINKCCSICNPNCQGSGLPSCPNRPGSCH